MQAAVNRGVNVELRYGNFITRGSGDFSKERQTLINAAQSVTFVLRGRNILLSYGMNESEYMRKPSDVLNIARLLQIKNPNKITNEIPKGVLAKGLSRLSHVGITRVLKSKEESSSESDEEMPFIIKTVL